ncbi:MAG: prepilin-type N-terminal cleavage/methylation domain-containing protein, partial [Candidatus Dadabacteria bacterium]|nr:prepilin-type N-terminal cleavage/methylation domain-containing protein [Candidatus Dadabacteria bacterium]NIS08293.1 prepilin-type N-terminal cleavage/methylation domain-containing protein [Candidatus Dadabacteria bacterium]NIV12158.1 prepilin-type N-terminal cleavage/methylation domain-containing protein [Fodinibius sp.]NIY21812.1 prepilin-type N-terminal cleavage/methylation domain-containing protein [Candidatus Dadabacteria bacterium]
MEKRNYQSGFTLLEVLVAVFIMATGFLALSQMEFLSLRQKIIAEDSSLATNILQAAVDKDFGELKRVSLLNIRTFIAEANESDADYTYCDGSADSSICSSCPCNPLAFIAPDPTVVGTKAIQCAAIMLDDLDIKNLSYTTNKDNCLNDYTTIGSEGMFILRRASVGDEASDSSTITSIYKVDLVYAVKSLEQFQKSDFSLALKDNLVLQGVTVSAQTEDYS